ncbi:MAG: transposase [Bacteroidales bacterium]|nr:transposase [Bacteroidales bacterium]
MRRNYKYHNSDGAYFTSFAVVDWLDTSINSVQVFLQKNESKDIFIDSLHFCKKEKGMEIFAWCIMTNHVHLIYRVTSDFKPQNVLGDLKNFKSNTNLITKHPI